MNEFDLIQRYFAALSVKRSDTTLSIGDDAAVVQPPAGHELILTTDTLVADVHFSADIQPADLGWKALAVNLSDLAAMGAEPAWALLSLTLPQADATWLEGFARGWSELAEQHHIQLVGGDTTRGPLSITVQAGGYLPQGQAITRAGAAVGDLIYVTGTIGDAGLALLALQNEIRSLTVAEKDAVVRRLHRPQPRCEAGQLLRKFASAAIDISDGLAADLNHLLASSHVGATLYVDALPLSAAVSAHLQECGGWSMPLSAGDDYELCFTVAAKLQGDVETAMAERELPCHWIGTIDKQTGLRGQDGEGASIEIPASGYTHFGQATRD